MAPRFPGARHNLELPANQCALALLIAFASVATFPAAADHRPGVTICVHDDFRGPCETFYDQVPDLGRTRIGDDEASSVRVDPGCEAVLYEDEDFRGIRITVDHDLTRLDDTPIENDELSSLEVRCRRSSSVRGGLVLFSDAGFRGDSQEFLQDDPDLRDDPIGNDRASSIRLTRGCEVILWSDVGYRGQSARIVEDEWNLGDTEVGNDRVSSLEIRCRPGYAGGGRWTRPERDPRGVVLYDDIDFRGRARFVDRDVANLGRELGANDRASSVEVSPGCEAVLWSDAGFRGRSVVVRSAIARLGDTSVGNDTVSSLQIRCRPMRRW